MGTTTTTTIPRPARQEKYSIIPEFGVLWNPLTAWAGPGDGGGGGGGIPRERDINSGLLAILRMFLVSLLRANKFKFETIGNIISNQFISSYQTSDKKNWITHNSVIPEQLLFLASGNFSIIFTIEKFE